MCATRVCFVLPAAKLLRLSVSRQPAPLLSPQRLILGRWREELVRDNRGVVRAASGWSGAKQRRACRRLRVRRTESGGDLFSICPLRRVGKRAISREHSKAAPRIANRIRY